MREEQYESINGLKYLLMLFVVSVHYRNSLAFSENNLPNFFVSFVISPAVFLGSMHLKFLKKILSVQPLSYLGKTTYSILATHIILIFIIRILRNTVMQIDLSSVVTYISFLLLTTAVGIMTFELIEKRFIPCLILKVDGMLLIKDGKQ